MTHHDRAPFGFVKRNGCCRGDSAAAAAAGRFLVAGRSLGRTRRALGAASAAQLGNILGARSRPGGPLAIPEWPFERVQNSTKFYATVEFRRICGCFVVP